VTDAREDVRVGDLPDYVGWPIFPFEGELRVKAPLPRLAQDIAREGEGGRPCTPCARPDSDYIWTDDLWRMWSIEQASALPLAVMLETRAHVDLGGFSEDLARELGSMIRRLERAIGSLPDVGRVHVNRWGDGGSHFHLWFLARPVGVMELYGFGMPLWYRILPAYDSQQRAVNLQAVADALSSTASRDEP
jgi:hypothetical protein